MSFVFELHLLLHPHPPILKYLPTILSNKPRFQLLSILHKISLSLTLSLEHLAPLYAPALLSSTLLGRAEVTAMGALAESNNLLAGEVGPILNEAQGNVERRETITRLKNDIIESLVTDRIIKAKTE